MASKPRTPSDTASTVEASSTVVPKPATLFEALVLFQEICPKIPHDKTAKIEGERGSFSYTYASLPNILATIRQPLSQCGLFLRFDTRTEGSTLFVRANVHHLSGEAITSGEVSADWNGNTKQGVKLLGSVLGYLKRYSLGLVLPIISDEDDDSASPTPTSPPSATTREQPAQESQATDEQLVNLLALFDKHGIPTNNNEGRVWVLGFINWHLKRDYKRFREMTSRAVLEVSQFVQTEGGAKTLARYQSQHPVPVSKEDKKL